jgi:mono/diheme cytochrome c family protein
MMLNPTHYRLIIPRDLQSAMRPICTFLLLLSTAFSTNAEDSQSLYSRHVKPILAEKCIQCHGPDAAKREADLRLDIDDPKDRQSNRLAKVLLERIDSTDPDHRMPPPSLGKPLTDAERAHLRTWIDAGSPFEGHWSYQPIKVVTLADGSSGCTHLQEPMDSSRLRRFDRRVPNVGRSMGV